MFEKGPVRKFKHVMVLAALLAVLLSTSFSVLADNPPAPQPDPNTNPMLAQYIKDGMKLYYLGSHSGLDGWLLLKYGKIQIVYTTADKKIIILGVLYDVEGQAITEDEIQAVSLAHPEIAASMREGVVQAEQKNIMNNPLPVAKPALTPGDRLMQDLENAQGVNVGSATAPRLYMVMDPNCPHCQATWKAARDAVFKNTLQIHMVPIGRNDESERAAARLMDLPDPLNVWDKYVNGDKAQLAGEPNPLSLAAVKANHALADTWNINETPYMIYKAKDGKAKVLVGEPKDAAAFIADIGQ